MHCTVELAIPLTDTLLQLFIRPPVYSYIAGQYLEIQLPGNIHPAFSIANAPLGTGMLELHIRHTPDNQIAKQLVQHIQATGQVTISAPRGHCTSSTRRGKPTLLLAAGTGFAPMKAIIEQAIAEGDVAPIHLYWGVNYEQDFYLKPLASGWAQILPFFQFTPVLGMGLPAQVALDYPKLKDYRVLVAGPPEFVQACLTKLTGQGLARENFLSDMVI